MEQSTISTSKIQSNLPDFFSAEEIEVAQILLDLPNLIRQREFPDKIIWGGKRKRSAGDLRPAPEVVTVEEEERGGTKKKPKVKAEAVSSPTSPLSFSPSESDEKSKHSLEKSSGKMKRGECLEIIDELTQCKESLRGDIQAMRSCYNKLKTTNLELKAKKQKLETGKNLNFGVESDTSINKFKNQQPSDADQTAAYGSQTRLNLEHHPHGKISPFLPSGSGSSKVKQMGPPICIPDLNVSSEETLGVVDSSQPLDPSRGVVVVAVPVAVDNHRAKSAEARRRRMMKMKEMKSSFDSIKPLQCR